MAIGHTGDLDVLVTPSDRVAHCVLPATTAHSRADAVVADLAALGSRRAVRAVRVGGGEVGVTRSVPEKTFEHWVSMYVAHRFPLASLWWPTMGEDVTVDDLGGIPGKAVLLEVKVPEQQANGTHVVTIDMHQLAQHLGRRTPVYYVFPEPPWTGHLVGSPWLGGTPRGDLAYARSRLRWFGEWTVVCSAWQLSQVLSAGSHVTATVPVPFAVGWRWRKFWSAQAACGSPLLPSLLISDVDFGASTSRDSIVGRLRDLRAEFREHRHARSDREGVMSERPRYYYAPVRDTNGSVMRYEQVGAAALRDDLATLTVPDMTGEMRSVVCALPFDALT